MIILGIESSCDETAVAIVDSDKNIRSNLVLSQIEDHQEFGGVVPEIAARAHADHMTTLIQKALKETNLTFKNIDAIAATSGPGLIGGIIVGAVTAKAIALSQNLPFIAVNHLEGHALTPRLTDDIEFPYMLLLISGGHTQILIAEDVGKYTCLGTTIDDALGECFDKSAKLMGLPYPGGPHLEKMAHTCQDHNKALEQFPLPKPLLNQNNFDFSFSGLKSAVRRHVELLPKGDLQHNDIANLAFAFHETVAEILQNRLQKTFEYFKENYQSKTPSIVISGGVAANRILSKKLEKTFEPQNVCLYAPPLKLCGDNAAMIAWAGIERMQKSLTDPLDFKVKPRWPLTDL